MKPAPEHLRGPLLDSTGGNGKALIGNNRTDIIPSGKGFTQPLDPDVTTELEPILLPGVKRRLSELTHYPEIAITRAPLEQSVTWITRALGTLGDVVFVSMIDLVLESDAKLIELHVQATKEHHRRRLLVIDESHTSLGRMGEALLSWGLKPDAVLLDSELSGGYLPCSAILSREPFHRELAAAGWQDPDASTLYAIDRTLSVITGEGLIARSSSMKLSLSAALSPLFTHSCVASVQVHSGLAAHVTLSKQCLHGQEDFAAALTRECAHRGVHIEIAGDRITITPALTITRDELLDLGAALDESFATLGSTKPATRRRSQRAHPAQRASDVTNPEDNDRDLLENVPPHHGH